MKKVACLIAALTPLGPLWLGCGGHSAPSTALTTGVPVPLTGCSYSFTTPNETTAPSADDGFLSANATWRDLHVTWVGDPSTTAVVTWASDFASTATSLLLGTEKKKVAGFSFAYPADIGGTDPPTIRIHQVHLCGLTPATAYPYTVGGLSGHFTTAPAGPASIKILVAGDSRGNASTWGQVMTGGAQTESPDFAIFTGDANELGSIQDEWEAWFAATSSVLPNLPLMLAEGNHEINARHYFSQFPLPRNQQWYDFDYGDIHFVVLNDTPKDPAVIAGDEAQFLEQSLSATTKTWKIVVHHKPPYTSSVGHSSEVALQQAWSPIYDRHGVDLVLNGHSHAYERSWPIKAGLRVGDGQGPVYVVEGGGGADPYDVLPKSFTAFAQKTFGYLVLDIAGRTLALKAKALDGTTVDQYSITK